MTAAKQIEEIQALTPMQFCSLVNEFGEQGNHDAAKSATWARCATDLELFACLYFPHYCQFAFNTFHDDYFKSIKYGERQIRRARGAPRGYAKSVLVALIKPLHDICYGLETYILWFSATFDLAVGKLKDIRSELLNNDRLLADYGISLPVKKPGSTGFEVSTPFGSIALKAVGAGTEARGLRYNQHRPSKIILDDTEDSDDTDNEILRQKLADWYFQVVSNLGNEKTNIELVGTILHRDSLLSKLLINPAYESKTYKAVISWSEREDLWQKWRDIYTNLDDADRASKADVFYIENEGAMLKGVEVLWPEKEPYLYLMKELVEKGLRAFMKEKQGEPLGVEDGVFKDFHWYRETAEGILIEKSGVVIPWIELKHNAYGVIDPATGQTKAKRGSRGDFTCILTGFQDRKGRVFVHSDWTKRAPPGEYIQEIFEQHALYEYNKFGVETNLYRNLLLPNIVAERTRREAEHKKSIKIPFYDIEQIENKEKRIYTMEPRVSHGWVLFNRALSKEFMNQHSDFPRADHDDAPDSLEMLWSLIHNRYKAAAVSMNPIGSK